MNKSDSEKISAILEKNGYKLSLKENKADLIVVNICSIRQSAVDRAYNKIKNIKNKKIILTGCILKEDKEKFSQYGEIKKFADLSKIKAKPEYPEGLISIMEGCNNFCTYCVVPYTRGRECYKEKKEIINKAKDLIKRGFQKITLIGQNVNSYPKFSELLKEIANLPGNFQVAFLTSHPKDFSDELIEVMAQNEKIVKHLNLPVQSGDNKILKKMNRPYTIKEYKNLIKKIRKKIPNIILSTDIIIGFPGETKKQFENTIKLFKEIKFNNAYISKYSPRPGTASLKLKDNVSLAEKKKREKVLIKLINKNK